MSKELIKIENRIIEPIPGQKQQQTRYMGLDVIKFSGPSDVENVDHDMCLQFTVTERIAVGETNRATFQIRSYYQLQKLVSVLTDVLTKETDGYFHPLMISQDEVEGTLDFKIDNKKKPLMVGDRKKFIEYAVLLRDLDNHSTLAGTCLLLEGYPTVEKRSAEIVRNDLEHVFAGNTVETEFLGETGRTVWGVFAIQKKGWKLQEECSPRTMNLDAHASHG